MGQCVSDSGLCVKNNKFLACVVDDKSVEVPLNEIAGNANENVMNSQN